MGQSGFKTEKSIWGHLEASSRARGKKAAPQENVTPAKKDSWYKNPAYHQFDPNFRHPDNCDTCKKERKFHMLPGECQTARRFRLGL